MARTNDKDPKDAALLKAIDEAGGPAAVARFIRDNYDEIITAQAVCNWKKCPPKRAPQLARAAKAKGGTTTARDLRPDLAEAFEQVA